MDEPMRTDLASFDQVTDHIDSYVRQGKAAGIAICVAQQGKLIYRAASGKRDAAAGLPMTTDTLCRCYSMTKTLTAVAVLQLRDRQYYKLDDPVEQFLPELRDRKVALQQGDGLRYESATHPLTI